MAGGIDWFRWHHGSVTDPKFQLVARKSGARLSDVLAVWAFLLEKASASDERGSFGDLDAESVDCLFGFDDGLTASIVAQMAERGLIDEGSISSWEKRQPKRERPEDSSAARTRAYRDRQSASSDATQSHVTPCDATERQETPRGEERRVDEKREEESREPRKRGSRLPSDWQPESELLEWAATERRDLDISRTVSTFVDYWSAKPGRDGLKLDWDATFRNWVRNERAQPAAQKQSGETSYQRSIRERVERFTGGLLSTAQKAEIIDITGAANADAKRLG